MLLESGMSERELARVARRRQRPLVSLKNYNTDFLCSNYPLNEYLFYKTIKLHKLSNGIV